MDGGSTKSTGGEVSQLWRSYGMGVLRRTPTRSQSLAVAILHDTVHGYEEVERRCNHCGHGQEPRWYQYEDVNLNRLVDNPCRDYLYDREFVSVWNRQREARTEAPGSPEATPGVYIKEIRM